MTSMPQAKKSSVAAKLPATRLQERAADADAYASACEQGLSEVVAQVVARRTVSSLQAVTQASLADLPHPNRLADMTVAQVRVAKAVAEQEIIGVLTDYDVDGITGHAVVVEALRDYFGHASAQLVSLIGHRLTEGYGVSDKLVERILALPNKPTLIITVDCGSSDEPRIARLNAAGIDVVVTDHHGLPKAGPPASALAVINPQRTDCDYPDGTIAGCMVAWQLMSQVRAELMAQDTSRDIDKLGALLDFVALGTVADAVSLGEANNRAVVNAGLKRMNQGLRAAWQVLQQVRQSKQSLTATDMAFFVGPRINARGRVADPDAALKFLLADNKAEAAKQFQVLENDNQTRREIESRMVDMALQQAEQQVLAGRQMLVAYHEDFHPGVQGIVASRLVDRFGHPAIVLSPSSSEGLWRGSARSIDGCHIREVLQAVADAHPTVLQQFGGHPMAAGLSLQLEHIEAFVDAVDVATKNHLQGQILQPIVWTDGALAAQHIDFKTWQALQAVAPFGRGFEAPMFANEFVVNQVKAVGQLGAHLSLQLSPTDAPNKKLRAIWFRVPDTVFDELKPEATWHIAYELSLDEFMGGTSVQLIVRHANRV